MYKAHRYCALAPPAVWAHHPHSMSQLLERLEDAPLGSTVALFCFMTTPNNMMEQVLFSYPQLSERWVPQGPIGQLSFIPT